LNSDEIKQRLIQIGNYGNIFIPEFTWDNLRIDVIIVDIYHRWIRGFEIKTSRADFFKDEKWTNYSKFCSSLSIVCPEGLIKKEEVGNPFGLLWICETGLTYRPSDLKWVKRPKNIQKRNCLAWFWTYLSILERELPRMYFEIESLKCSLRRNEVK
jgi:hypothetical protein